MTNFERRIHEMTIEKLIHLENSLLECGECYCQNYCKATGEISCNDVRTNWLNTEESNEHMKGAL